MLRTSRKYNNNNQRKDMPRIHQIGEKATQGSGISTQKLWSTPRPPPGPRREEPAMKKAPRSSFGQPLVADSDTDSPVESEESDTIASRVRTNRPDPQQDTVRRQIAREKEQRDREARKAEDKKLFEGLKRRYKRQAAEDEMQWMARILESERGQAVTLATRWVDQVASVRAPSGAQRNRQLQSSNPALAECVERRRSLHKLQGAMRRAHWLPAGPTGHMPDFPVAYHNPRDEGPLRPSRPSPHSFVVAVDREGEETWIVDPLHLHGASCACRAAALAAEDGPEAELLVPSGQSRQRFRVQAHEQLEDSRTRRSLRQGQVHDGAAPGRRAFHAGMAAGI